MRNFLKRPSPIVFVIVAAVVLGSVDWLIRSGATAPGAATDGISHSSDDCPVCRLPLHGRSNEPSKLGPKYRAKADLTEDSND
jgi:hypothetical protein